MKKQGKLQLRRATIGVLADAGLRHAVGGARTENFSVDNLNCSGTCTCSQPCTNSCRPCVA